MAPNKVASRLPIKTTANKPPKKNKTLAHFQENFSKHVVNKITRSKRKAETSPIRDNPPKRSALEDVTNNVVRVHKVYETRTATKKLAAVQSKQKPQIPSVKTIQKQKTEENLGPPPAPALQRMVTRSYVKKSHAVNSNGIAEKTAINHAKQATAKLAAQPKTETATTSTATTNGVNGVTKKRLSNVFEKNEETLYSTAVEDINDTTYYSTRTTRSAQRLSGNVVKDGPELSHSITAQELDVKLKLDINVGVPEDVCDYDKENWNDIYQVSHYAMDIFNYYKEKETQFPVSDYMTKQIYVTPWMRSLLVDWMVEIQESFELNHETLYLGVKLVDLYLDRVIVDKETLQLVGAVAMFIASKFDERIPPKIEDFIYICDEAYERSEMIDMECRILKVVDFNLGIPLSYRFLRRYARCGKIAMPVLTLARYILEYSLMSYETISIRDSILASASLYIALQMKHVGPWTPTLQYYTGYKVADFKNVAILLNRLIHERPNNQIMTIRNKYSHKLFFEVAKTPLLDNNALF